MLGSIHPRSFSSDWIGAALSLGRCPGGGGMGAYSLVCVF